MKKTYLDRSVTDYMQAAVLAIKAERLPAFFVLCVLTVVISISFPLHISAEENNALPKSQVLISAGIVTPEQNTERKTLTGKIGAKNLSGIALVYEESGTSSKEMWMPFEDGLYLEGYTDIESLTEGDQVRVTYDEYLEFPGKFVLRAVALIDQAPEETPEVFEEDSAL